MWTGIKARLTALNLVVQLEYCFHCLPLSVTIAAVFLPCLVLECRTLTPCIT